MEEIEKEIGEMINSKLSFSPKPEERKTEQKKTLRDLQNEKEAEKVAQFFHLNESGSYTSPNNSSSSISPEGSFGNQSLTSNNDNSNQNTLSSSFSSESYDDYSQAYISATQNPPPQPIYEEDKTNYPHSIVTQHSDHDFLNNSHNNNVMNTNSGEDPWKNHIQEMQSANISNVHTPTLDSDSNINAYNGHQDMKKVYEERIIEENKKQPRNSNSEVVGVVPLDNECKALVLRSSCHNESLSQKITFEKETRDIHFTLWSFVPYSRRIESICGCGNHVFFPNDYQVANIDHGKLQLLMQKFDALHNFNIDRVFMSLYRQTFTEFQLLLLANYMIGQISHIEDEPSRFEKCKLLLNPLFECVGSHKLSLNTQKIVQSLILYISSYVITPAICEYTQKSNIESISKDDLSNNDINDVNTNHSDTLIDFGGQEQSSFDSKSIVPSKQSTIQQYADKVVKYYCKKLSKTQSMSWGASLFQPSISQVVDFQLLNMCSSTLLSFPHSEENHFISLLRQIPWEYIGSIESLDKLRNQILSPLKNIMDFVTKKGYSKLMITISNLLIQISLMRKELSFECLNIVVTNLFPLKPFCIPILESAPYHHLNLEQLENIFCSIYGLTTSVSDYYNQSPNVHYQHRVSIIHHLVKFPIPGSNNLPKVQSLFQLFYHIANFATPSCTLQRVIIQELFFFSFVMIAENTFPMTPVELQLVVLIRNQAFYYLNLICCTYPKLLTTFIVAISANLQYPLAIERMLEFISPTLFQKWELNLECLYHIGYFFAHRKFPDINPTLNNELPINHLLQMFIFSPPTINLPPIIRDHGIKLGLKLFSVLIFHSLPFALRLHIALMFISVTPVVSPRWVIEMFFGNAGHQLFASPLNSELVQAILQVNPRSVAFTVEFTILQQLLSLSLQEEIAYYFFKNPNPNADINFLSKTGFYQRLSFLLSPDKYYVLCRIISKIDRERNPKDLRFILDSISKNPQIRTQKEMQLLQAVFLESLLVSNYLDTTKSDQEYVELSKSQRITGWIDTLVPSSKLDRFLLPLLNDLIAYLYCTGLQLSYVTQLVSNIFSTTSDITALMSEGFFWVALIALCGFKQLVPLSPKHKDNALVILTDIQKYDTQHSSASVAIWLHFFKIFFSQKVTEEIFPKKLKDNLNKYFVAEAKHFREVLNDGVMHRVFYAFSTWNEEIINASIGDYIEEQNIHLLKSLYSHLPAHFQFPINVNTYRIPTIQPPLVYDRKDNEVIVVNLLKQLPDLLPPPQSASIQSTMDASNTLHSALYHSLTYFRELSNSQPSASLLSNPLESPLDTPIVQQLRAFIHTYSVLCETLYNLDHEFLELSKSSYVNQSIPFCVTVSCSRGKDCEVPSRITDARVQIEQPREVVERVQTNRAMYDKEYIGFFEIARSIAQTIILIKNTVDFLLQQPRSAVLTNTLSSIFFSILRHCVFSKQLPPGSSIVSDLIAILLTLGRGFFPSHFEYQILLVEYLLNLPPDVTNPKLRPSHRLNNDYNDESNLPLELYSLYQPTYLLEVQEHYKYLEALQFIAIASSKSAEEEVYIASCFNIDQYIQSRTASIISNDNKNIIGSSSPITLPDPELELILSLLPTVLSKPSFSEIGTKLIEFLMRSGYEQRLLFILFSPSIPPNVVALLSVRLNLSNINLDLSIRLLQTFKDLLPIHPNFDHLAITFLRNITLLSPQFMKQFHEENFSAYDDSGCPTHSPLWSLLYSIFSTSFFDPSLPVHDDQYTLLFQFLHDLIITHPTTLVDKVWFLLSENALLESFGKRKRSGSAYPLADQMLVSLSSSLPWLYSKFLYYDPNALSKMSSLLFCSFSFVLSIFSHLDWPPFFTSLATSPDDHILSTVAVQLLKLFLQLAMIAPISIPEQFRSLLLDQSSSLDWSRVRGSIFSSAFDGNVLLSLLESSLLVTDPSSAIIECAMMLRSIALKINHPLAILALVREIRSIVFFYIDAPTFSSPNSPRGYWYLSLSQHTSLITSCLLDPVLYHAPQYTLMENGLPSPDLTDEQRADELRVKEQLLLIFSMLSPTCWAPHHVNFPISISNSSIPPNENVEFSVAFFEKIKGLIGQFCSSVHRSLALQILRFIPLPCYSDYSEGSLKPSDWVEIVEISLRNVFIYSDDPSCTNLIEIAARNLQISLSDRVSMIATCKASGSSYTLLTILYQWRLDFLHSKSEYDYIPIAMIEAALDFTPNQYREFDLIPILSFILTTVNLPQFHPQHCQPHSMKILEYIRGVAGSNKSSIPLILTAKATEIFFYKLIRSKSAIANPKADKAIEELVDQLLSLQKKEKFKQYTNFFNSVAMEVLTPLFTIPYFENQIITTLFPIAQPILEKISLIYLEKISVDLL